MHSIYYIVKKDILTSFKKPAEIFVPLVIFFLINFIFSFSISDSELIKQISASIFISAVILCNAGTINRIIESEYRSGITQQIFLITGSASKIFIARIISSFLCFSLPTFLFYPIAIIFYNMEADFILRIIIALIPLSIIISILNCLFSTITSGVRNGTMVQMILSVPLYIPALVISLSYITETSTEFKTSEYLQSISGYLIILIPLAILLGNIGIKNIAED